MNKLIKLAMMMASVGAMLCIVGCGAKGPDAVAKEFMEKVSECDFTGARELSTKSTAALLVFAEGMAEEPKEQEKMEKWKGAKVEVVECKVDGEKATVILKRTAKDGTSEEMKGKDAISLIKQDGAWRVDMKK